MAALVPAVVGDRKCASAIISVSVASTALLLTAGMSLVASLVALLRLMPPVPPVPCAGIVRLVGQRAPRTTVALPPLGVFELALEIVVALDTAFDAPFDTPFEAPPAVAIPMPNSPTLSTAMMAPLAVALSMPLAVALAVTLTVAQHMPLQVTLPAALVVPLRAAGDVPLVQALEVRVLRAEEVCRRDRREGYGDERGVRVGVEDG